jgi:hypothetical protein
MVEIFHPTDQRPTLLDLYRSYHFDVSSLASYAGVEVSTVNAMMTSQPVERKDAEKILAALSTRYHKDFSLDTVHVVLRTKPRANKSEVARLMEKIDTEYESGMQAVHGLAQGIGQHKFITTRMESIANNFAKIREEFGEEVLMQAMSEWDQEPGGAQADSR